MRKTSSLAGLLEGTPKGSLRRLSWRPLAELSDWELIVQSKTYHVTGLSFLGAGEITSVMLRDVFDHHGNVHLEAHVGGPTSSTNHFKLSSQTIYAGASPNVTYEE